MIKTIQFLLANLQVCLGGFAHQLWEVPAYVPRVELVPRLRSAEGRLLCLHLISEEILSVSW